MALSAWTGHRRFAYDLIRNLKPGLAVELGTHWGISFYSFCQAAVDTGSGTRCIAVDTWLGDDHAGRYSEEVFATVNAIVNAFYRSTATLLRTTFAGALPFIADNSAGVIHIDGYHTYEAAKDDYMSWLPKLAANGVVLLHDIAVRDNGFGVHRLWDELKVYPHLEFDHCFGLGVVCPKGCPPQLAAAIANADELKRRYAAAGV
nr:class I SAM-dependent methyltransferase [Cohnella lubricantis]